MSGSPQHPSRRDLLTFWRRQVPAPRGNERPAATDPALRADETRTREPASDPAPAQPLLRPPGALPEEEFLATCERCARCVAACPVAAIHMHADGDAAGPLEPVPRMEPAGPGPGPVIDPRITSCILCEGLPCTRACPTGALRPLDDPAAVRMGTAAVHVAACLAHRGLPCRACADVCPIPGAITLARGERTYVPVIDSGRCVGCGVCVGYCPTDPPAIRVLPPGAAPSDVTPR